MQNVTVVSFDHWNYDKYIVDTLKAKGYNSHHIKIGNYKHASSLDKITNTLSKLFLRKNLKKIRRQQYIIDTLDQLGKQDQILVINPEVIDLKFHYEIKKRTHTYKAYLYDSNSRQPITHLLDGIFDEIYSFDKEDIATFGFKEANNYIYLDELNNNHNTTYDAVYLGSCDDRVPKLAKLAKQLKALNLNYNCLVIGNEKRTAKYSNTFNDVLNFSTEIKTKSQLLDFYKSSKVVIDLVRDNQTGLSFRFFEAMATQRKIITDNSNVKNYPFYNLNNILVLDDACTLNAEFFNTPYETVPEAIYNQYTLNGWIKNVLNLD